MNYLYFFIFVFAINNIAEDYETIELSQTKKDLNAIQDFKQSVRVWSAEDTDRMTDEIYQKYKDRTQSIGMKHIKDLRDLQDKAVERGEDSSRYDDLIEQSEEAFFDSFGFEINYDSSEN